MANLYTIGERRETRLRHRKGMNVTIESEERGVGRTRLKKSRGVTTTEERDLWHMPIVLGLILALMCAEWGYRRAVGLA